MFDPISVALALAYSALNATLSAPPRTVYPTFSDPAPSSSVGLIPALAAHIDSESRCIHITDPSTNPPTLIRVEIPHPSLPEYDYCVAYLNGETFHG